MAVYDVAGYSANGGYQGAFTDAQLNGFTVQFYIYGSGSGPFYTEVEEINLVADGYYLDYPVGNQTQWNGSGNNYYYILDGYITTPPATTTSTTTTSTTTTTTNEGDTTTTTTSTSTTTTSTTTTTTSAPSGYGLYMYKEFTNIGGREIRLEIEKKGFVGEEVEIEALSSSPIFLQMGNVGDPIYSTILKTSLTINIVDTEQIDYSIFFTPDSTMFKIKYYVDSNLEWTGYLTPDSFIQDEAYRGIITLIARDNLGYLSNIDFDLTDETVSILGLIQAASVKASLQMNILFDDFNLYSKYSSGDLQVTYANISSACFNGKNWYDSLSDALMSIGAQLRYIGNNRFALFNIADLYDMGGYGVEKEFMFINKSGVKELLPAWRTLNIKQDYNVNDELYIGHPRSSDYTFSEVKQIPNRVGGYYYVNTYIISNDNWESTAKVIRGSDYPSIPKIVYLLDPDDYMKGSLKNIYLFGNTATLYPNTALKVKYNLSIPSLDNTNGIKIEFKALNMLLLPRPDKDSLYKWMDKDAAYYFKVRYNIFFETSTTKYVLKKTWEEWDESPTNTDYREFIYSDNGRREDLISMQEVTPSFETLTININSMELDGTLYIELYPWSYSVRTGSSPLISTDYVLALTDFSIQPQLIEEEGIEKTININLNHNVKSSYELPIGQVPVKSGNYKTYINGLYRYGTYFPALYDFHRSGGDYFNLYDLLGIIISDQFSDIKQKYTGDIICDNLRSVSPTFDASYKKGDKRYILNAGTYNVSEDVMNVELIEIWPFEEIAPDTLVCGYSTISTRDAWDDAEYTYFEIITQLYPFEGVYYKDSEHTEIVDDGYYLAYPVPNMEAWDDARNVYYYFVNGILQGSTTTSTTTSTSTTSTTSTTTPAPSVSGVDYEGFGETTAEAFAGSPGTIWRLNATQVHYTTYDCTVIAPDGYYMTSKGATEGESYYFILENGLIVGYITTTTTTTTTSTTTTTTSTTTTLEPTYTEVPICGFSTLGTQDAWDEAEMNGFYYTGSLYRSLQDNLYYIDSDLETVAFDGFYLKYPAGSETIWDDPSNEYLYLVDGAESQITTTTTTTTTTTSTTTTSTTTTTTQPPLQEYTYVGYGVSIEAAYADTTNGSIWSRGMFHEVYAFEDMGLYAADGYYCTYKGGSVSESNFIKVVDSIMVPSEV